MDSDIKRILLWSLAAVAIIGGFLAIIFLAGSPGGSSGNNGPITPVTASEWIKGNKDSKVELVEYSDFQCPACLTREPLIKKLMDEFSTNIKFVYREFPLRSIHKNSQIAAQAGEAAGMQNKFWEMHDKLFENQSAWSPKTKSEVINDFIDYAGQLGLNVEQFKKDLESDAAEKAVNEDYDGGDDAGVAATPTFFLNGKQINPGSYEDFRELIRTAIESAAGENAS